MNMKKYCLYLLCVVTIFLCSCSSSDDDSNNAGSMTPTEITAIMKGSWGVHGNVCYDFYKENNNPQNQKVEGNYQGVLRLLDGGKYNFTASEVPKDLGDFIYWHTGASVYYFPQIINGSGDWEILKKDGESYLVFNNQSYFRIYNLSKEGFKTTFSREETNNKMFGKGILKFSATMDSYGHD